MNRVTLVIVVLLSLFFISCEKSGKLQPTADVQEPEEPLFEETDRRKENNEVWASTGFSLDVLFSNDFLNANDCYQSEEIFSSCLMAIDALYRSPVDASYSSKEQALQLGVSGGLIQVFAYSKEGSSEVRKTRKTWNQFNNKKRESFRRVFRTQSTTITTPYNTRHRYPVFGVNELEQLMQEALLWARENVDQQDQPRIAGGVYNVFLEESVDPFARMIPQGSNAPSSGKKYFGIGAHVHIYKWAEDKQTIDDETLRGAIGVKPFPGSPAQASGLKKGDLILAIDGVDVRGLEGIEEGVALIKGPKDTQVRLTILDICDGSQKDVVVTRGPITYSSNWIADSRFVNTKQLEYTPCEDSSSNEKAFYIPLGSFLNGHLCQGFGLLQFQDLQNPNSIGMILDLRENGGGDLHETVCMLDTIIQSDEIMLTTLPVEKGKLNPQGEVEEVFFTKKPYLVDPNDLNGNRFNPSGTYNKNIVVLIDEDSASASEIFAGTIQDMKRGYVIGGRSFGKGTVQSGEPVVISQDGSRRNPLLRFETTAIYTLNSARSPQSYGIISDFLFSWTGEPIELDPDHVSQREQYFFNNIGFDVTPWEQNRPDEVAEIMDCVSDKSKMGEVLKDKIANDKRYSRPFMRDYQLELAKDVLSCMPKVAPFLKSPLVQ